MKIAIINCKHFSTDFLLFMCGHLMKFRQNYFTHVRIQKFKVKSLQHQQMRFGQPQTIAGEELLMNCKQKLLYGEKRCVK